MLPSPSQPSGLPTPATVGTSPVAAGTKRPAASDLQRSSGVGATPSKRHASATKAAVSGPGATGGGITARQQTQPSQQISLPMTVTEEQLVGRTPEQLIATILQIQAQHQQYVANISAQYESIAQQLNELRGSLAAFYNSQVASHQAAASQLQLAPQAFIEPNGRVTRPGPPPAPMLPPQIPPGPPRAPVHTGVGTRPRPQVTSPQQASHPDTRLLPKQQTLPGGPQTPGPPSYDYRTVGTVEEVWKEYREGLDGQPAIEQLDAMWGSRWRPEPRGRTWYSRRKVIWDKIKEFIAEGLDEADAVKEVEKLRDGGTINKLIRLLQDERKDKGVGDDSMTGQ